MLLQRASVAGDYLELRLNCMVDSQLQVRMHK